MLKSICVVIERARLALVPLTSLALLFVACATTPGDDESPDTPGGSVTPPVAAMCPVGSSTDPLTIATDRGLVKGMQAGTGFAFLGIPFAQPPLGALRLMPPVQAACWSNVVDATHYGNRCTQQARDGSVDGSEDCLQLNVWIPALPSSTTAPLPVLVWMYGGGNNTGSTNVTESVSGVERNRYDGQALANSQNAVVVSFNYRVGVLGFLAHPALKAANAEHTTGNYGLLDAVLALHWVQDNIAAFGGDKTHVMLFGQSAGAFDTCSLVASRLAHGLFSAALMQSGNCAAESLGYQYDFGKKIIDAVGCSKAHDVAACLRKAPLDSLVKISNRNYMAAYVGQLAGPIDPKHSQALPFGPTVDGYVLDDVPLETIRAGKHNHVPLAIGTTTDEVSIVGAPAAVVGCLGAELLQRYWFASVVPALMDAYPCKVLHPLSAARALGQMATDAIFTCPSRRTARAAAASQTEPVFRYVWSHVTPSVKAVGGAVHGSEVPYVFGTLGTTHYDPTPAEQTLSKQVQTFWANLAASGNPNSTGLPTWNKYDPTADNAMLFDTPTGNISALQASACDFWDSVQ